jgi:putative MATE family efflux protein
MTVRDHTEGSIIASILRMGIPSMIGFLSGTIYDLADMFWLAKLGAPQVAAVTIFSTFYWVLSSSNQIVGSGSVSVISRRYGEKDFDETEAAIKETMLLKLGLGIFFGVSGFLLAEIGMRLLGAEGNVIGLGVQYGHILTLGMAVSMASYTVYTALRGVGDPNKAMVIMLMGTVLNAGLDPLFIFGWLGFPCMGIRGAAVASVIAYFSTFTAGVIIFYGGFTNIRLHLRGKARLKIRRMWRIVRIGLPGGVNSVSFALSRSVVMSLVAIFGTDVIAAYGVGNRIAHIGVMVIVGISLGTANLIGHNLGAGKNERAWKTSNQSIGLAVGIMTVFGAMTAIFARNIVHFFFQEPALVDLGITLLRIQALAFPMWGIIIMIEDIFTGAGDTLPPMIVSVLGAWVLEIPVILIATKILHMNQNGVWWAIVIATTINAAVVWKWYRAGKWIHRNV